MARGDAPVIVAQVTEGRGRVRVALVERSATDQPERVVHVLSLAGVRPSFVPQVRFALETLGIIEVGVEVAA